jgi:hypothetical protein
LYYILHAIHCLIVPFAVVLHTHEWLLAHLITYCTQLLRSVITILSVVVFIGIG